jgi:hypothetical protein
VTPRPEPDPHAASGFELDLEQEPAPSPLLIPTHPDVDPDEEEGAEATDLANPVTVNNRQVLFANEAIRIAQRHVGLNRELIKLRLELKVTRRAKDRIVRHLLTTYPPERVADTKTLKLVDAYVERVASRSGKDKELALLDRDIERLEDLIEKKDGEAENQQLAMAAIKLASQNASIFLSYVKNEARNSKYGI